MPNIHFRSSCIVEAGLPIRPNGPPNSYADINRLKGGYGVYVFHGRDDQIVRYVGSAGTIANRARDVPARLKQHYTKSKKGASFYLAWLTLERPDARRDDAHLFDWHADFLSEFGGWSLATLTTMEHRVVELVPAVEHALIHALRPKYNGHPGDPGEMPDRLSATATWGDGRTVLEVLAG